MRLRRERAAAAQIAPRGVRIRRGDGTAVECDMLRDEDQDHDGIAEWVAVPRERFILDPDTDRLEVDMLPGRTCISLLLPVR